MAISSGQEEEQGGFSDINVTPLTDVLLVLLIIFLITGSSITSPSHNIALPEVITKEKAENANVVIDVDPQGDIYVGNDKLEVETLKTTLERLAKMKNTDRVIINADNKTPYKSVVVAMNSARKAGLINIALATSLDESKAGKGGAGTSGVKIVGNDAATKESGKGGAKK
ncbi:biopolymer transporter ExbD [bacterium]|nr:biopolymer transporter ExbD [bacterium]